MSGNAIRRARLHGNTRVQCMI